MAYDPTGTRMYHIRQTLTTYPEFEELGTDAQHWIIMDILGRFQESAMNRTDLGEFVDNYIMCVKSIMSEDSDMMDKWANFLKAVHWGLTV